MRLTDRQGNSARSYRCADEPALRFPEGELAGIFFDDPCFRAGRHCCRCASRSASSEGVNLASIAERWRSSSTRPTAARSSWPMWNWCARRSAARDAEQSAQRRLDCCGRSGRRGGHAPLANLYRPTEALGVQYGNLEQAVFWYRKACEAGYANAQVDFYEFAPGSRHGQSSLSRRSHCLPGRCDPPGPPQRHPRRRSGQPSSSKITRRASFSTRSSKTPNLTTPSSAGPLPIN